MKVLLTFSLGTNKLCDLNDRPWAYMARDNGFEPLTYCLEGNYSSAELIPQISHKSSLWALLRKTECRGSTTWALTQNG